MRGDRIFQIFGVHDGRVEDVLLGEFRTRDEAEVHIGELKRRVMHDENWAARYHTGGFVVREALVETDFELPPLPKPRDKYFVRTTAKPNRPGTWDSTHVEVFRRRSAERDAQRVAEYERSYAML